MDAGTIMISDGGMLRVVAAIGPVPPAGSQLASHGALALAVRQSSVVVRQNVTSAVLMGRDRALALELLIPAVSDGQIVGLLCAATRKTMPAPEDSDMQTLEALGGITGTAMKALSPTRSNTGATTAAIANLTPREQQVFSLLPRGLTNADMARELGIAPGTVKVHVERILGKLRLRDRTQAAVKATRMGYG